MKVITWIIMGCFWSEIFQELMLLLTSQWIVKLTSLATPVLRILALRLASEIRLLEDAITFIQSSCFENKTAIRRFQDFIFDVDGLNDILKVNRGLFVAHP